MDSSYEHFLSSLSSPNTAKVARSYRAIGACTQHTEDGIRQTILSMKPNSQKTIITICNIWRRYAEFLDDQKLLQLVQEIDSKTLWQEAKPFADRKFMSHTYQFSYYRVLLNIVAQLTDMYMYIRNP